MAMPDVEIRHVAMGPARSARVALLLPLSGPHSRLGAGMLNAAQLALFDFGSGDFELVIHDTRGTGDGAARAASQAIGEGASLILGPLLASSVRAVAPIAQAQGIPVVAFSNDRTIAGNGVFAMGFFPSDQVERVVRFAYGRGLSRFAALVPDNQYGETAVRALDAVAADVGALVTRVEYYDPAASDFSGVVRDLAQYDSRRQALEAQRAELERRGDEIALRALRRLETVETVGGLPFDALLLADGGKRLQAVAAHLPYYDIDPGQIRMLGTGLWEEPGIGAEPALLGGWFAAPSSEARAVFERSYRDTYGQSPPRLATLAYDATALAAVLAQEESGPNFSAVALTATNGFFGRDGIFRFLPDGTTQRGLAVLEVQRRDFKVVDDAPDSFVSAMFSRQQAPEDRVQPEPGVTWSTKAPLVEGNQPGLQ